MASVHPIVDRIKCVEDILERTGWGIYYKFLVGFTSVNSFLNAIVLLSMTLGFPLSSCDTTLTTEDIMVIHISFTCGRAIGGFLLASLSDNNGKNCMIPKTLIILFTSSFIIAFSYNAYSLYLAVFFLGSGLQANLYTMKIYLAEILPTNKRGFFMIFPDLFWTLGYFSVTIFTYFTADIPSVEHAGMDMRLTIWRIIFALTGGLSLMLACASALLEMNPRYLLFKRRIITAALVLKQFYAINRSKYSETFDLQNTQLYDLISDYNINIDPEPVSTWSQTVVSTKVIIRMIRLLMRKQFLGTTLVVFILKFSMMLGILNVNVMFSKMLHFENSTRIQGFDFLHITVLSNQKNCTFIPEPKLYETFMMLSINVLLGQVTLLLLVDRVGRKIPLFFSLQICGFMSFVLVYSKNFWVNSLAASMFITAYSIADSTIFLITIESFPTAVRGTVHGLSGLYPFIVLCLIYKTLDFPRTYIFLIVGASMLGSSVIGWFLTETKRRPMVE